MWTAEHRNRCRRESGGFPSNLSNAEWAVLEPLIPAARPGGRPRKTDMRSAMNAILYLCGQLIRLEIVRRNPAATGFEVIKKR